MNHVRSVILSKFEFKSINLMSLILNTVYAKSLYKRTLIISQNESAVHRSFWNSFFLANRIFLPGQKVQTYNIHVLKCV